MAAQRSLIDAVPNAPSVAAQRQSLPRKGMFGAAAQLKPAPTSGGKARGRQRTTGLPSGLRAGVESLSGVSMDKVSVHYNSSQPAQLNALAYAQGNDIHLAPGQEQHLPHEAWHLVQQAQGRVRPTLQMKQGVPVNDDEGLEHEADVMGRRALETGGHDPFRGPGIPEACVATGVQRRSGGVVQRLIDDERIRVEQERKFRETADILERRLGAHLSPMPAVNAIANDMLARLRTIVDAWAEATRTGKEKVYEQEFTFTTGKKYYGSFRLFGEGDQEGLRKARQSCCARS